MFDIKFMINTRIYVFEQILGQVLKISNKTSCFVLREAACARTDRLTLPTEWHWFRCAAPHVW